MLFDEDEIVNAIKYLIEEGGATIPALAGLLKLVTDRSANKKLDELEGRVSKLEAESDSPKL